MENLCNIAKLVIQSVIQRTCLNLFVFITSCLIVFSPVDLDAQCVLAPVAGSSGSCSGQRLIVTGLTPGGEGSNTSGVLSIVGGAYVNVANNTSLQMPGDFTYEMWVKPTGFTANNTYFENGTWPGQTLIFRQDNPSRIALYASGTALGTLAYAPELNVWTHLALVRSGGSIMLYANGNIVGSFTSYAPAINPITNLWIGRSQHTTGQFLSGYIDEFRLWKNVALAPGTLEVWRNRELAPDHPYWANLSCEFKFNGNYTDARGICSANGISSSFAAPDHYTYTWTGLNAPAASTDEVQALTEEITPPREYTLVVTGPDTCSSPAISVMMGPCAAVGPAVVTCPGETAALSLAGYSGTLQWQFSESDSPYNWQDISGATTSPYTATLGSSSTHYRAIVTDGGVSAASNSVTVAVTISSSLFNPGIAGAPEVSVGGTTAFCISNPFVLTASNFPSGGEETLSAGYRIHAYKTVGEDVFSVPAGFNQPVDVLVVAGGGGGGSFGGGGGAGGLIYKTSFNVSPGSYTVTVGAGGAGATTSDVTDGNGANGTNSAFDTLIAIGGGGGGTRVGPSSYLGPPGNAGGSGGGGANSNNAAGGLGGAGTAGQGNAGGAGGNGTTGTPNYAHGGGGGAGGRGMAGKTNGTVGATGGVGLEFPQFAAVGGMPAGWFAGGGGGGVYTNGTIGLGGTGGGGNGGGTYSGAPANAGENGAANTGGGGGGGGYLHSGGAGGSGVVIVRYLDITASGSWLSSNSSVATVDASGVVTGLTSGTSTIQYIVGISGCTVALVSIPVTVNSAPEPIEIGGTLSVMIEPVENLATGGTVTTEDGYRIHTFTASGTFTIPVSSDVEALVVAGGGGGGSFGGGGGAGGLLYNPSFPVAAGSYPVTVGAGGKGATTSNVPNGNGENGFNSVFGSLTAIGGGGGATRESASTGNLGPPGNVGGSGGGGANSNNAPGGAGGAAVAGQGNPGGAGGTGTTGMPNHAHGGGGGAGGPGIAGRANDTTGATGGIGLEFPQFAAVGGSPAGWFSGGGGGAVYNNGIAGSGGLGGGGNGGGNHAGVPTIGTAGSPNTGGGGGGGGHTYAGGAGGSGIVILRYPLPASALWTSSNEAVATVDATGTVTAIAPGTATITRSYIQGNCSTTQSAQVVVYDPLGLTIADNNNMITRPNPVSDLLMISLLNTGTNSKPERVEIYDATGRLVYSKVVKGLDTDGRIEVPVSELANGAYHVVVITAPRERYVQPFVVAH